MRPDSESAALESESTEVESESESIEVESKSRLGLALNGRVRTRYNTGYWNKYGMVLIFPLQISIYLTIDLPSTTHASNLNFIHTGKHFRSGYNYNIIGLHLL